MPVTSAGVQQLQQSHSHSSPSHHHPALSTIFGCSLAHVNLPLSKRAIASASTSQRALESAVLRLLHHRSPPLTHEDSVQLLSELPHSWERHGDLVSLPQRSFCSPQWQALGSELWETVACALKCERLARNAEISPNKYRSSRSKMLLGRHPWVEHTDNGVKYSFDVTKTMFSSGNITEKGSWAF